MGVSTSENVTYVPFTKSAERRTTETGTVRRLIEGFRVWRIARQNERALAGLSNRTLRDIGVSRSEIPGLARRAAETSAARPSNINTEIATRSAREMFRGR